MVKDYEIQRCPCGGFWVRQPGATGHVATHTAVKDVAEAVAHRMNRRLALEHLVRLSEALDLYELERRGFPFVPGTTPPKI